MKSSRVSGCRKNTGTFFFLWETAAQAPIMGLRSRKRHRTGRTESELPKIPLTFGMLGHKLKKHIEEEVLWDCLTN